MHEYQQKNITILGFSISGKSVAKYCRDLGANISITDDNPDKIAEIIAAGYQVYQHNQENFAKIDYLIVSPGISNENSLISQAIKDNKQILLDVDLLLMARGHNTQFIAITGTNGKSTTTKLMNHCLNFFGKKSVMGGNIGIAAMDLIAFADAEFMVLELSSYQLERMKPYDFGVSILLNLSYDHLERHGNMAQYSLVKQKIFNQNGANFIGIDDEFSQDIYGQNHRFTPISGIRCPFQGIGWHDDAMFQGWQEIFKMTNACPIQGYHNKQNIAAVWGAMNSIFKEMPLSDKIAKFSQAINNFVPLPHRQQLIAVHHGVRFVNDSKATNVASAYLSLQNYNNIHWLVGGQLKEGDDFALLNNCADKITKAYCYGAGADYLMNILSPDMPKQKTDTMAEAFREISANLQSGDVVLLAPAAASFDQFKNFEDRGNQFIELIQNFIKLYSQNTQVI